MRNQITRFFNKKEMTKMCFKSKIKNISFYDQKI